MDKRTDTDVLAHLTGEMRDAHFAGACYYPDRQVHQLRFVPHETNKEMS